MAPQTPTRYLTEEAGAAARAASQAFQRGLALLARYVDERLRTKFLKGLREREPVRVIPAAEATPTELARHPNTTIRLTTEQTEAWVAIEREAQEEIARASGRAEAVTR